MKFIVVVSITSLLIATAMVSCEKTLPAAPAENELLDGPMEGLTAEERSQFLKGDIAFNDMIFTAETGLGPVFVANSCGSCHAGDGKGHPSITFTRFGQSDTTGNTFLEQGGPQLQHRAIPGYAPEQIPAGATSTNLVAPAVTGLGFFDAVTDATILAMADPDDLDGDGISGRPNWNNIPEYAVVRSNAITQNGKYLCRFGKKASSYDLLHQAADAFNQDIGITSEFEPIDTYSGLAIDPEVDLQTVRNIVMYLKTLKAPLPRDIGDADVEAGRKLFTQVKCAKCHVPTLQTGDSPIAALANKDFSPYTDLLLHDMGSALNDNYTEGTALPSEWRTPALWGLGLSQDSQGGDFYLLHDGRATSIEGAIGMHNGEATQARNLYNQLSTSEQRQLVSFLKSL